MTDIGTMTLVEAATVIERFGTALAAVFALAGIAMVYVQLRGQRRIQREATAMSLFREYLQLALERPDLLNADFRDLVKRGQSVPYELFVANMLFSFDEVLQSTQSDDWREMVRGELSRHVGYLRSPEFREKRRYYAPEIASIIKDVCSAAPATPVASDALKRNGEE